MTKTEQKHSLPALLSFFIPGLGQAVKGQFGKGIVTFLLWIIFLALIFVYIGLILAPIFWIWNIYDAYNSNSDSMETTINLKKKK